MIKVLLVDDHPPVIEGILASVDRKDVYTIFTANSPSEAIAIVAKNKIDVIVSDYSMPPTVNVEWLQKLKQEHPRLKVLIMTKEESIGYVLDVLEHGLNGMLSKRSLMNVVWSAIAKIREQSEYFCPIIRPIVERHRSIDKRISVSPSKRQLEVLRFMVQGYTSVEIAEAMGLKPATVEGYKAALLSRFNAKNGPEMIFTATKQGFLKIDEDYND